MANSGRPTLEDTQAAPSSESPFAASDLPALIAAEQERGRARWRWPLRVWVLLCAGVSLYGAYRFVAFRQGGYREDPASVLPWITLALSLPIAAERVHRRSRLGWYLAMGLSVIVTLNGVSSLIETGTLGLALPGLFPAALLTGALFWLAREEFGIDYFARDDGQMKRRRW